MFFKNYFVIKRSKVTDYAAFKPDFPSIADGIAEPRPDMNIKVAAFTVSDMSINT